MSHQLHYDIKNTHCLGSVMKAFAKRKTPNAGLFKYFRLVSFASIFALCVISVARTAVAENIIKNGSFETGDLSSWIREDLADPLYALDVRGAGTGPVSPRTGRRIRGLFDASPTDGGLAVTHGFAGRTLNSPASTGRISIAQDVIISKNSSAILTCLLYTSDAADD